MSATVKVRRTVIVEYEVDLDAYRGMTREEIVAWESDTDNIGPETMLENIVSEVAEVTFSDE